MAGLSLTKQQAFATAIAGNTELLHKFGDSLSDGTHGLAADEATFARQGISVGALVKNFIPLLQNLMNGFSAVVIQTS
jgi:hypothetical protein